MFPFSSSRRAAVEGAVAANACNPPRSSPPSRARPSQSLKAVGLSCRDEGRQHMGEQENVRIVRDSWDAWNAHDAEGALKNLDEKHVWETDTLPAPVAGRDGYRQAMQ